MTSLARGERWLTAAIVGLGVPVHLIGLLAPSLYRDPAILLPQNRATDLVTLLIGLPLLAAGAVGARRGSSGARVVWAGALAYLTYCYGMYALGVRWNPLFLGYVALFGLSLFALIIGLVTTDPSEVRSLARGRIPARSVAAYLIVIAVAAAGLWLAEEIGALIRGTVPPSVVQFETPTNIVHVFDLAVALPALVIAAVLLLRDQPWGYLLAGVVLVKATSIGLWVVAMVWFSAREGIATPVGYTAFFVVLTALGAILIWRFLTRLTPRPAPSLAR